MNSTYKLLFSVFIALLVGAAIILGKENILPSQHAISNDSDDEDESSSGPATVELMTGKLVVHIPKEIQQQANLEIMHLVKSEFHNEMHALARVIDIQSLTDLRSAYLESREEISTAETALQVSAQEYDRLKLLRKEASNISERQLQQARLEWISNQSKLQSARVKKDNIKNRIMQGWGAGLSEQVMNSSDIASELFEHKSVLLLVTLEGNQELPDKTDTIFVNVHGKRDEAQAAYYISPASFADNTIYGQSWFFHTKAYNLPTGIYLDAWIPDNTNKKEGVLIPADAIIWYVDKPWTYVKKGEETFFRKELKDYTITRNGWFVQSGFKPGENIVLHGGQMLLAEEFRWSIPDEDDNP